VLAWSIGGSEAEAAPEVVWLTRKRTLGRRGCRWISDGHPAYLKAIRRVYRDPLRTGRVGRPRLVSTPDVGLTQGVKERKGRRVVRVSVRHCFGPAPESPYTVRVERLNGVLRDRLGCVTRRTHAFAKHTRTWDAAAGLCLFEHNWMHPHRALRQQEAGLPDGRKYRRQSPAMVVGLADHLWSWAEFLTLRVYQPYGE
jgi:hypothetical protein